MVSAWRIVKRRFVQEAFSGEGARRFGGRWNTPGNAVVYVSETRALAMLEVLAGLQSATPLPHFLLIPVRIPSTLIESVELTELPRDWRHGHARVKTREIGDLWLAEERSAVLRVPSAVVDGESNYLLNPAHRAFPKVRVGTPEELVFDPRLFAN